MVFPIKPAQIAEDAKPTFVSRIVGAARLVQSAQQQRDAMVERLHPRRKGRGFFD